MFYLVLFDLNKWQIHRVKTHKFYWATWFIPPLSIPQPLQRVVGGNEEEGPLSVIYTPNNSNNNNQVFYFKQVRDENIWAKK
jgi:hypothetical protein